MKREDYTKYFFLALMFVILYISFILVKPFIGTLVMSVIVAYAFYPLYKIVNKKLQRKNLSAFLMTVLIIILITVPLIITVNTITKEMSFAFITAKQRLETGNLLGVECEGKDNLACRISEEVEEITSNPQTKFYIEDTLKSVTTTITTKISQFIFSIPRRIVDIFIMFFVLFYLLRDGKEIVAKGKSLMPLKKEYRDRIVERLNDVTYGVVYVYILVAAVQGILGGIGFSIFGISNPVLWGFIMGLFALLPVGSVVIWLPAAIYLILQGAVENTNSLVLKGILLIIYGAIVVGFSDNVIRLKVIGEKTHIHPVLIVLGVVGGLIVFGFIGTIIGPLILAVLLAFVEIYEKEK